MADHHRAVAARHHDWFDGLGEAIDETALRAAASDTGDADLIRLVLEYLPLTFSRRHGDPSRPWNRFSISVRDDHGDEEAGVAGVGGEPLVAVDHPLVAVLHGGGLEERGVGAGVRLGHGVARADLAVEQRLEIPLLLGRAPEVGEDLGVS